MKKKMIRIITILSLIIFIIIILQNFAFADDITDRMINNMKNVSEGDTTDNNIVDGIDTVFYLIRYIGTGLSIIVGMKLGITYMMASVEDKAEIKKQAIPVLVGCVLVFGTSQILGILANIIE